MRVGVLGGCNPSIGGSAATHASFAFTGLHSPHPSPPVCIWSRPRDGPEVARPRGMRARGSASLHGPAARVRIPQRTSLG
eukprot:5837827-Prymnesium_polylepis.1